MWYINMNEIIIMKRQNQLTRLKNKEMEVDHYVNIGWVDNKMCWMKNAFWINICFEYTERIENIHVNKN